MKNYLRFEVCVAGIDLMSEREGGTWFGVSKSGRIGVLLNIPTHTGPLPDKKPRGNVKYPIKIYDTTLTLTCELVSEYD